jgi:uncharacterized protein (DUF1697 family)
MRYALLFRGLNVGAAHRVPMAELKAMLGSMGFGGVQTYLQSGNAVLESDWAEAELCAGVRDAFLARFGFASDVIVRNARQLVAVADGLPFSAEALAAAEVADPQAEHLYVYFLDAPPDAGAPDALLKDDEPGDAVVNGERELYLLCRSSIRLSKTAIRIGRAYPRATARNWKTVENLRRMLEAE